MKGEAGPGQEEGASGGSLWLLDLVGTRRLPIVMGFLHVEKTKCTRCGACAAVCPGSLILIGHDGPEERNMRACLACGHCVAVCPVEALDNLHAPLAGQVSLEGYTSPTPEAAATFLRSRRSIRQYREEQVPREVLLQILDTARFASTGGNSQGLSYLVMSDREKLRRVSSATIDWMEEEIYRATPAAEYFSGIVRGARQTGKDVILRDAPHLIVALCDAEFPRGQENAHFAFAYAELIAPTLGVGTCWAGLFQRCAIAGYRPVLDILDIPDHKKVAGGLMAGYPKHKYHRLVDRNSLDVTWG
jgi:nitroreductase/NAD-dependent dihydropyrimidine dehydrogenase PreA subunit